MSADARYDQTRYVCACGCAHFVQLTPVQAHAQPSSPDILLLPPLETPARLPVAECVRCRTRYDRTWQEVV